MSEDSPTGSSPRQTGMVAAESIFRAAGGCVLRMAGLYDIDTGPHAYWFRAGTVRGHPAGLINLVHYDDAAGACMAALLAGAAATSGGRRQRQEQLGAADVSSASKHIPTAARTTPGPALVASSSASIVATACDTVHGNLFLISDGTPVSRRDIVSATSRAKPYANSSVAAPVFADDQLAPPATSSSTPTSVTGTSGADGHRTSGGQGKRYNCNRARTILAWTPQWSSFKAYMEQCK